MVPYFTFPVFEVLGQTVSSFDIFVTLGLFFGFKAMLKYAQEHNLSEKTAYDLVFVAVITGFMVSHVFHGLFYEKPFSWKNIFFRFNGISSVGGMLGGWIGAYVYLQYKKQDFFQYLDGGMWAVVTGFFWGRVGCFSVHDHPGSLSTFFLAVDFPGGARHDLGFYEALFLFVLILIGRKWIMHKSRHLTFSWFTLVSYGVFRFLFDFLRIKNLPGSDARYVHLTPGQFVAIGFVILGLLLYRRKRLNG
ncbi:MAG: prolipoprotein diacylglyceryl transferase [Deltaproteobacteria bacterium]|nr:prolipoprotein diacylglyceryl transferase [Deltaproteobacteria bacterium]